MKREALIKKWLDNDLNSEELKAFNALEDSVELTKLSNSLKAFKAPEFVASNTFESINSNINSRIDDLPCILINRNFKIKISSLSHF